MAKIITIAQQKGGSGKSTLAAHMAIGLRQRGATVGLIDIDPQNSLTTWFKLRQQLFGEDFTGIGFASCSGIRVNNEISNLKLRHDYIIIDCPPHTETEAKTAIRSADLVLVPMQASPTDIWASVKTIEFAKSESKLTRVLMNRYMPNARLAKTLELPTDLLLEAYLGNRVGFASSMASGKTVIETEPKSPAALEIKQLVNEVIQILT